MMSGGKNNRYTISWLGQRGLEKIYIRIWQLELTYCKLYKQCGMTTNKIWYRHTPETASENNKTIILGDIPIHTWMGEDQG